MKYNFQPTSPFEKFATKAYYLLVENFSQTFFVGGMVRDLLLKRKITDIDVATQAKPGQVVKILASAKINCDDRNKSFGSVIAEGRNFKIEINTFRKDLKANNRYPKVQFIESPRADSQRRDFTINSLYFRAKSGEVLDYRDGLADLYARRIKFIGTPEKRIKEDPLRIIRALRFALILNFTLEGKTKTAIKNHFNLVEKLTKTKIEKEINKIKNKNKKIILKKVINSPKLLDKYFK